jgi:hypothetical protein
MSADTDVIGAWLPTATRMQIEDLCRLTYACVSNAERNAKLRVAENVERDGWDPEVDFYTLKPRFEAVYEATNKNNLHVAVQILSEMTGTLNDYHVKVATILLERIAQAVTTIEARRG